MADNLRYKKWREAIDTDIAVLCDDESTEEQEQEAALDLVGIGLNCLVDIAQSAAQISRSQTRGAM